MCAADAKPSGPVRRRAGCAALVAGAIAGCAGPQPAVSDAGVVVRDSAGIEIVINEQEETPLGVTPVLEVGVVDGNPNLQFFRIRTIAIDSSGGFWIVDRHPSLRHFDAAGQYRGSAGGLGRGPGEADSYGSVWLADDRVLAWGRPSILQLFEADGTFLTSRSASAGMSLLLPLGHGDGRFVFELHDYSRGAGDVFRSSVHVLVTTALSAPADTIRTFIGPLSKRFTGDEYGRASYFYGDPSFALAGVGRLYVTDTLAYRIDMYDLAGTHVRRVIRPLPPRPYDPAWAAEVEEGARRALTRDGQVPYDATQLARFVEGIVPDPPPTHLPFIDRLFVAHDGTMWVARADRHPRPGMRAVAHAFGYIRPAWRPEWRAAQVFDIFTPAGHYRGTVELPSSYEPMAVTANRVYGVRYDDLDVEFITVYEVTGAAGALRQDRGN